MINIWSHVEHMWSHVKHMWQIYGHMLNTCGSLVVYVCNFRKGSTIGQLYPLIGTMDKNEQEQPCYYVCQSVSPTENNEDTVSKDVCSKSLKELENLFRIDN